MLLTTNDFSSSRLFPKRVSVLFYCSKLRAGLNRPAHAGICSLVGEFAARNSLEPVLVPVYAPAGKVSSLPLVAIRISLRQNLFLNLSPELPREGFGVLQICIIPMCFSFNFCSPLHRWLLVCLCFGLSLGLSPLLQEACSSCRAAFGNFDFWNFEFWNRLFISPVPKPHHDPGTINEINLLQGLSHATLVGLTNSFVQAETAQRETF